MSDRLVYNDLFTGEVKVVKQRLSGQQRFLLSNYRAAGLTDYQCRDCFHGSWGGSRCMKFGTKKQPMPVQPEMTCDCQKDKNMSGRKKTVSAV